MCMTYSPFLPPHILVSTFSSFCATVSTPPTIEKEIFFENIHSNDHFNVSSSFRCLKGKHNVLVFNFFDYHIVEDILTKHQTEYSTYTYKEFRPIKYISTFFPLDLTLDDVKSSLAAEDVNPLALYRIKYKDGSPSPHIQINLHQSDKIKNITHICNIPTRIEIFRSHDIG